MGSHGRIIEVVTVGRFRINRSHFAAGLVLLASSEQGLQQVPNRSSAVSNKAGMKLALKRLKYCISP